MDNHQTYVWVNTFNPFLLFLLGLISLAIDFIPSFIAFARRHPNRIGILILNILFGWTGIGWIILLVWSLLDWRKHRPVRII